MDDKTLRPLVDEIRPILNSGTPKTGKKAVNDVSDLVHLATCIHHRMTGFITRELAILRKGDVFRSRFNLEVLSPAEVLSDSGSEIDDRISIVATVGSQELSVIELHEQNRNQSESFLASFGLPRQTIATVLDPGTSYRRRCRSELRANDVLIGVASWSVIGKTGREMHLYLLVNEAHEVSTKAIDHVLESVVRSLPSNQVWKIGLFLASDQDKTRDTALKRGFSLLAAAEDNGPLTHLSRFAYKGIVTKKSWGSFCTELKGVTGVALSMRFPTYDEASNTGVVVTLAKHDVRAIRFFDFETSFSPLMIVCAGRPAVLVPIQERYASELLHSTARQLTLLPSREATLHVERAYFMKSQTRSLFSRGAIVLFYVSGANGGRQQAVGLGRVTFYGILTTAQAILMLSRQGVLEQEELERIAGAKGTVSVFTFDNFIPFDQSISYRELKAMGCIGGANLVTSQALTNDALGNIVAHGFPGGH